MNEEKSISDMYLAAALLAYGCKLVDIDRSDPRRQQFVFSGFAQAIYVLDQNNVAKLINPSLDEIETKFIAGVLVFPPSYPHTLKDLKSAIHAR